MTVLITDTERRGRYVRRFTAADGYVHDFATVDLQNDAVGVTYVPRCQRDYQYPSKRFFSGELRGADGIGLNHHCPACRSFRW